MATTANSAQAFHFVSLFGASSIAALHLFACSTLSHTYICRLHNFHHSIFAVVAVFAMNWRQFARGLAPHTHVHEKSVAKTRIFAQWRALVHRTWPCKRKLYDIDSLLPPHKNRSASDTKPSARERETQGWTEFDISRKQQHFFPFAIGQQTL